MAAYTYQIVHRASRRHTTVTWDREQGQVWGSVAGDVRRTANECADNVLSIAPGILDSVSPHLKSDHGLLCLLDRLGWEFDTARGGGRAPQG